MKAQSDLLTQFGAQAASQKILVGDMNSIFGYILTALLDHDARLTALEPTPEAATAPPAATPASPAPAPPKPARRISWPKPWRHSRRPRQPRRLRRLQLRHLRRLARRLCRLWARDAADKLKTW